MLRTPTVVAAIRQAPAKGRLSIRRAASAAAGAAGRVRGWEAVGVTRQYDLVLQRGLVIDPGSAVEQVMDVAVEAGRVVEVAGSIDAARARRVVDVAGLAVLPGLIDTHVHVSSLLGGANGFAMLARAGVTTALDCAGPLSTVIDGLARGGAGLNVAVLNGVNPAQVAADPDPSPAQVERIVGADLDEGALGVKLMGGHYPMTPAATARFIAEANRQRSYVAYHAGTTAHGSNYHGFVEALQLAGGNAMHLAHINAYCRGVATGDSIAETRQALASLEACPRILTEFHLATINGTSGRCLGGVPESHITRTSLRMGGYPETEAGLAEAFAGGYAHVTAAAGGANVLLSRQAGLDYWQRHQAVSTVGFPVNDRRTAFLCATGRHPSGRLTLTALSTDGGGIPRNFLLSRGLLLVELDAWSPAEFVTMTSLHPARMLGLPDKGHLSPGADADITVADLERRRAVLTIVGGEVVMAHGIVTGRGGRILCTGRGVGALDAQGVPHEVVDLGKSMLYARIQDV